MLVPGVRQRADRPAALFGPGAFEEFLGLAGAESARRQTEPLLEQPVEIGGVAEAAGVGHVGDRRAEVVWRGERRARPLKTPFAKIMAEGLAVELEQLLQIALGDAFQMRDARGRQVQIVQSPLDRQRQSVE